MNWNEFRNEVNMLLIPKKGLQMVSQNRFTRFNEKPFKNDEWSPNWVKDFVRKAFETQIWLVKLIDCETFFIKTFAGKANIYDSSSQRDKGKQDKESRLPLASGDVSNFLIESEVTRRRTTLLEIHWNVALLIRS